MSFNCPKGRRASALFTLALLTQSSLYSGLLLAPLVVLLRYGPQSRLHAPTKVSNWNKIIPLVLQYFFYLLVVGGISTVVTGNLVWIKETWGAT